MLKYTKDRIINIDEPSSEEDWTDSTSNEEEKQRDRPVVKKVRYSQDIQHAVTYSIIKRLGVKNQMKKGLLKQYQQVYENQTYDKLEKKIESDMISFKKSRNNSSRIA